MTELFSQSDTLNKRYTESQLEPYIGCRWALRNITQRAKRNFANWSPPAVNIEGDSRDGYVLSAEWCRGKRHLTLFFTEDQVDSDVIVTYLKSWGTNMTTEMEEGDVNRSCDFTPLWDWLTEDLPNG